MKYFFVLLIFFLNSTGLRAQFYLNKKVYEIWESDRKYWENIYKYPVKLDSAYYTTGQLIYTNKKLNDKVNFKKLYPNGDVHVIGNEVDERKGKLKLKTGNWIIYYPNQQVKKEVNFRNQRRWGVYREYNQLGGLLKEKVYRQKFTYGFNVGFSTGEIDTTTSNDTLITSNYGYGLDIGFLLEYNISNKFTVRTLPTESLQEYELNFDSPQGRESLKVDFLIVKVPMSLSYELFNNINILAGMSYNLIVRGKNNQEFNDTIFSTKQFDLGYELGVFYEIKFPNFIAAPELRYSPQISNWASSSQASYSKPIERMYRNQLTFTLVFKMVSK